MSCYFRHIKNILDKAGIEVNPENKQDIDQAFHQIAGVTYKNCSATWEKLKQEFMSDEGKRQELVRKIQEAVR